MCEIRRKYRKLVRRAWVWWYMPVNPIPCTPDVATGYQTLKASLSLGFMRPCLKNNSSSGDEIVN